jgi:hypothetical protein
MISFLISSLSTSKRISANAFVYSCTNRRCSSTLSVVDGKAAPDDTVPNHDIQKSNSKRNKRKISSFVEPPFEPSTFPSWSFEERDFFRYESIYESKISQARVGRIHTPHGIIDTPGFVAVATNGALKGLDFRQADEAGQQLVFCNSYHLMLQPGPDVIQGKSQSHDTYIHDLYFVFFCVNRHTHVVHWAAIH